MLIFSLRFPLKVPSTKKLIQARTIYVNKDSSNIGFPYLNCLGEAQWKITLKRKSDKCKFSISIFVQFETFPSLSLCSTSQEGREGASVVFPQLFKSVPENLFLQQTPLPPTTKDTFFVTNGNPWKGWPRNGANLRPLELVPFGGNYDGGMILSNWETMTQSTPYSLGRQSGKSE